ncbi:MAG: FtsQ-type POTRA domain-containing protein [Candidatus Marinimicrobia bacterium]|nr:FtsQ-type POTRA domain-containing protein [Candidatus Neomarinimicrobiota bacterium]
MSGSGPRNRRRMPSHTSVLMVKARAKEARAARRKITAVVGLAVIVLVLAVGVGAMAVKQLGRVLFSESDLFNLRHLDLASDGALTPVHLREYAGLEGARNLFALDLRQVERNLLGAARVRSATVTRVLPDTLRVRVIERVPLAVIVADRPWIVDRQGYVLGPSAGNSRLPVIRSLQEAGLRPGHRARQADSIEALELLDLCDRTPLGKLIGIAEVQGRQQDDYLELRLRSGARVLLGRTELESRLTKLAQVLERNREMGLQPSLVDARGQNQFAVQY